MNSKRHGSPYILPLSAPINGPLYALLQRTGCSTTCCESRVTGVIPRQFLDSLVVKRYPTKFLIIVHTSFWFVSNLEQRNATSLISDAVNGTIVLSRNQANNLVWRFGLSLTIQCL